MEIPIWAVTVTVGVLVAIIGWLWNYFTKKVDSNAKDIKATRELVQEKFENIETLIYTNGNEMRNTVGVILKTMASDKDEVKEKVNKEIKDLERYVSSNYVRK